MVSYVESGLLVAFSTIVVTMFIAELTDKDALLLLTLAMKLKSRTAFAAGSTAFTISSAIIITAGYFLLQILPVYLVKLVGGIVMIGYALWQYFSEEGEAEGRMVERAIQRTGWRVFLSAISLLILLDLAGDGTEVLEIIYVAHYANVLLVFLGSITGLIIASALETIIGGKLVRVLSIARIRIFSLLVFLIIGTVVIVTTLL
ncbi:MAG: TMEM165/GDT1 family protein [Thaumarchaeota archaeon]|nr:TMEM165/GDT1 family protein [Nitrososphaerota archaeon]